MGRELKTTGELDRAREFTPEGRRSILQKDALNHAIIKHIPTFIAAIEATVPTAAQLLEGDLSSPTRGSVNKNECSTAFGNVATTAKEIVDTLTNLPDFIGKKAMLDDLARCTAISPDLESFFKGRSTIPNVNGVQIRENNYVEDIAQTVTRSIGETKDAEGIYTALTTDEASRIIAAITPLLPALQIALKKANSFADTLVAAAKKKQYDLLTQGGKSKLHLELMKVYEAIVAEAKVTKDFADSQAPQLLAQINAVQDANAPLRESVLAKDLDWLIQKMNGMSALYNDVNPLVAALKQLEAETNAPQAAVEQRLDGKRKESRGLIGKLMLMIRKKV